jgi:hypothetical protein
MCQNTPVIQSTETPTPKCTNPDSFSNLGTSTSSPLTLSMSTDTDTGTGKGTGTDTDTGRSTTSTEEDYTLLEKESQTKQATNITQKIIYTILWLLTTYISKEFSKFLCIHQSQAGSQTFVPASYTYSNPDTYFDNTILTYGTDYLLCLFMLYASYKCYKMYIPLGYKASALFACYAISVGTGGYAHYTFRTMDSLNTNVFRFWWSCCGKFMCVCIVFFFLIDCYIFVFFDF